MTANRFHTIAAALLLPMLSGCFVPVPIPPSGYQHGSRENIGESVPDFIVPGQTTRDDVLLHLGAPDGKAPDDSWVSYGSASGQGGIGVLMGVGGASIYTNAERMLHRRLVVRFDTQGIVTTTQLDTKVCPKYETARSCLDPSGRDFTASAAITADGGAVAQYSRMISWPGDDEGQCCEQMRQALEPPYPNLPNIYPLLGELAVTRTSLIFAGSSDSPLRIPFAAIESVSIRSFGLVSCGKGGQGILVKRNDHTPGTCFTYHPIGSAGGKRGQVAAAAALIQKQMEEAGNIRDASVTDPPLPTPSAP